MFLSVINAIRVPLVAVLAIAFTYFGATWFRSTQYYSELRYSETFQCFAWMFISAIYSALSVTNLLFRLLSRKKA